MIEKLMDPSTIKILAEVLILVLYITGRITKGQFIAEQMKVKEMIDPSEAKAVAVETATKPITAIFDVLNMIPVVNTKLPIVNVSIPDLAKGIIQGPVGLLSDIMHNIPLIGTNVRTPN